MMRKSLGLAFTMALALVLLLVLSAQLASATSPSARQSSSLAAPRGAGMDIVVTSTADSGNGTLRWAMSVASSGDTIVFRSLEFPPSNPVTISLVSPLPEITQGKLTIDASAAGVILDGSALSSGDGLHITSDGNVIKALQIYFFPDHGVRIDGGASNNLIGGTNASPGGTCGGDCNVISGNGGFGVIIQGAGTMTNTVSGNYIGTDVNGTAPLPNGSDGVSIGASSSNLIGSGNVVAYNGRHGISVYGPSSSGNTITENSIYSNGGLGIELGDGGNLSLPAPVLTEVTTDTVKGASFPHATIEVFSDLEYEGQVYEGATVAESTGHFTFTAGTAFALDHVTATATDGLGNTSEFGAYLPHRNYLPIVVKGYGG